MPIAIRHEDGEDWQVVHGNKYANEAHLRTCYSKFLLPLATELWSISFMALRRTDA
jgi:hypothetical protein